MSQRAARRRRSVLMSAIREATKAELAERGYAGVTFEGVARRAETGKSVLYRRYSTRAHMVLDAMLTIGVVPDLSGPRGALRTDLLAMLEALVARFKHIGMDTYRGLMGEVDDEVMKAIEAQTRPLLQDHIRRVLSDARLRGELGPNPIPDRAEMAIFALLRHEMFFNTSDIDAAVLADIVDNVYLPLIRALASATPK